MSRIYEMTDAVAVHCSFEMQWQALFKVASMLEIWI